MLRKKNISLLSLFVGGLIFVSTCFSAELSNSYQPGDGDNTVPRGGTKLYYVSLSGAPSNAVITNVEVSFNYIAYNGVEDWLSARFNKGSDPGTSEGVSLVSQGALPAGKVQGGSPAGGSGSLP